MRNRIASLARELGYHTGPSNNKWPRNGYAAARSAVSYMVPPPVPIVPQPSSMTCWAAVYTMMYSWARRQSVSIETAMQNLGPAYLAKFQNNQGIMPSEVQAFINTAGFVVEHGQSMPADVWEQKLRTHGPFWVITDEQPGAGWAIHARIIHGITGDGTLQNTELHIIDPAGGRSYREKLQDFYNKSVEAQDYSSIQMVFWPPNIQLRLQQSGQPSGQQSGQQSFFTGSMSARDFQRLRYNMAFNDEIPLDPGTGGRSIMADALQTGDIILSTTNHVVSESIRRMTRGPVSHAILFTGIGQGDETIVEAIGQGVVLRTLTQAIQDATVAVAFRHPRLTQEQGLRIRDFAGRQLGQSYDRMAIVRHALFQIHRRICDLRSDPDQRRRCTEYMGRVFLGTDTNDQYFCSELVVAAYQDAGVPLAATPPNWNNPSDIADLRLSHTLEYVGHLKTP